MPYSLVSATALGFDLVRLPAGDRVAEVVLAALTCGPDDLRRLADHHPGPARRARWRGVREAGAAPTARGMLALAAPALDLALAGDTATATTVLRRLERAPLGDLDALERLIRDEAMERTWVRCGDLGVQDEVATLAADVLVDAAASAFCAGRLPASVRSDLAWGYTEACADDGAHGFVAACADDELPTAADDARDSPYLHDTPTLRALLAAVRATTAPGRQAWREAVDTCRVAGAPWAPAMNEASWAAHLSGRTHLAAVAQMRAVGAFRRAGFTAADGARGVWNALSGLMQATIVRDLLTDDQHEVLVRPWVLVSEDPAAR